MSDNTMHESGPVSDNDEPASTGSPADELGTPPHAAEILGLRMPLGIGTMLWGDTPLDRRITDRILSDDLLRLIRERAHAAGVRFVDTAEGYGGGSCEARVRRAGFTSPDMLVATKFLPALWRWSARSVVRAARNSARRLGTPRIDLLYIHSPIHPRRPDAWIRGAARAVRAGLVRRVGVSNFNARQLEHAVQIARQEGIEIISNQIMFSPIVYGAASLRDTVRRCRELGVAPVGFGTVGQGLLGAGLTPERLRSIRLARIAKIGFDDLEPLRRTIAAIADRHRCAMGQVCIRWAIAKGVVPLVGIRSLGRLEDAVGATHVALSAAEIEEIDSHSLAHSTFDRPRRRRAVFVILISLLMLAYRVSRVVPISGH